MKLQAPRNLTFLISLILVVIGVIAQMGSIPALGGYGIWLVLIGYIILALGNLLRGL